MRYYVQADMVTMRRVLDEPLQIRERPAYRRTWHPVDRGKGGRAPLAVPPRQAGGKGPAGRALTRGHHVLCRIDRAGRTALLRFSDTNLSEADIERKRDTIRRARRSEK